MDWFAAAAKLVEEMRDGVARRKKSEAEWCQEVSQVLLDFVRLEDMDSDQARLLRLELIEMYEAASGRLSDSTTGRNTLHLLLCAVVSARTLYWVRKVQQAPPSDEFWDGHSDVPSDLRFATSRTSSLQNMMNMAASGVERGETPEHALELITEQCLSFIARFRISASEMSRST